MARLASLAGILAQVGYKRRPGRYGGKPAVVVNNTLDRQFEVDASDKVWVTDITYIKTHEGWLFLSVVIDLLSRHVVGWSARPRMTTDLALQALLVAVWPRKPKAKVMIHSDQGSQCHRPRVAGIPWPAQSRSQHEPPRQLPRQCRRRKLLSLLKRERIRRRTYLTREAARQGVFDYIEMFYNRSASKRTAACCRRLTSKTAAETERGGRLGN